MLWDNALVRHPCTIQEAPGSKEGPKKSSSLKVTLPLGHFEASLTFCLSSCFCFLALICFFLVLSRFCLSAVYGTPFYCPPLLCLLLILLNLLTQSILDSTDTTRALVSHHPNPNNTSPRDLSHKPDLAEPLFAFTFDERSL